MADQGKWFKLWCASIHDQELQNLELEDWARWAMLGTYIKEHGEDGKISFDPPYRALLTLFRLGSITDAIGIIKRFPNCTLGERETTVTTVTNSTVTLEIEYKNWLKYQGDYSNDRVRKFRDKKRHAVTAQEEKRREETRREEKRREIRLSADAVPYPLPDPKNNPTACLVVSYKVRKGVPHDNRDWDKLNFGRCSSAAKSLLSLCRDLGTADKCLTEIGTDFDSKGMTWTLETIAKHAPDWLKKNGRINADSSRARLRMAITESKAKSNGQSGVEQTSTGPIHAPVRNVQDGQSGSSEIRENDNGRKSQLNVVDVDRMVQGE